MKLRKIAPLAISAVMLVTAAGCGAKEEKSKNGESAEKVTLNMLFNDTDENVQKEMEYVMEHLPEVLPNVEVELDMVPGDAQQYETKVRTLISAGGEGLDVWWERGGSWATPILSSDSALPLDSYLEE